MKTKEKENIAQRLQEYCDRVGGQTRAANTLDGVSATVINRILTGKWGDVSDDAFRSINAQISRSESSQKWHIAETRAYKRMDYILANAQEDSLVMAVTGDAGSGKTEAIKNYALTHRNVYHLCCSEYWNRRTFMAKLLQAMGVDYTGCTVSDMMDDIIDALRRKSSPLIVLDEADKLTDQVLYFFISLYNQLEDHCGIILCATGYLEKRIARGLRMKRKGYEEIFSRMGRKFVKLQVVSEDDIASVCIANGVTDAKEISKVIDDCECDLRRVKRAVWAILKSRDNDGKGIQ